MRLRPNRCSRLNLPAASNLQSTTRTSTIRRSAGEEAIDDDHDDEDEHDKTLEFPDRARGRRRPRSVGEEAIDDDHDDEDEPDQKTRGIEPPNGLSKRSTSVNSKQNVQP